MFLVKSLVILQDGKSQNNLALCAQEGWTPLHVAVQGGRVDIIKLLISRGADITIQNKAFHLLQPCFCIGLYLV